MNKPFVIEKGIPLPNKNDPGYLAELIRGMEIGDSFSMPKGKQTANAFTAAKFAGVRLTSRTMPDKTIRVWRVA